ncbi:transposase [Actinomadura nitritigenes]|uniref:Transposase n=1 Tax=Actinomadura nitritigenes TaxID=134602 RepID=A0ABS3QQM0_9ACTN|nr:transposase [Actinomadura nitritigenes]
MSRYRLRPTSAQVNVMLEHCRHARFVWNLAVEQHGHWRPGRRAAPAFIEQCRQLSEARAESPWLRTGSAVVQQQALRDFSRSLANFFNGTHGRPTWRKAGRHEGFRIVGVKPDDVRRLSRRTGEVKIPKVGWVRFCWSRAVPEGARSFRVTCDRAGRWHLAFAHIPHPVRGPADGSSVGVDRGVTVSAALCTAELLCAPRLSRKEAERLSRLQRRLTRSRSGSRRRTKLKAHIARLEARAADRRRDWVEQVTTDLARRFDRIALEDLNVMAMTRSARGTRAAPGRNVSQKSGLNKAIRNSMWGAFARRLEQKAAGRIVRVDPGFTSQRCSECGIVDRKSRESQARFRCQSCGYTDNADVNAARNICVIAAGHAVAVRGALQPLGGAMNREPQPDPPGQPEIPADVDGEDAKTTSADIRAHEVRSLIDQTIRNETQP